MVGAGGVEDAAELEHNLGRLTLEAVDEVRLDQEGDEDEVPARTRRKR